MAGKSKNPTIRKTTTQAIETPSSADAMKIEDDTNAKQTAIKTYNENRARKLKDNGETQISVILKKYVYDDIKRLASYRAGRKDSDKQEDSSIQGIINIALREYREAHMEELTYYDSMMENAPKRKQRKDGQD